MRPPFDALGLLKAFHDTKKLNNLYAIAPELETHCLHSYSYNDFYTAAVGGSLAYYSERQNDYGTIKAYYSHAAMDDYYWLAKEYGSRHGLPDKMNPYFLEFQKFLAYFLFPDDWSIRWFLVTNTNKPRGCGLVFVIEPEYENTEEFICDLFIIWNRYTEKSKELRRVLAEEANVDDQGQEWKEAA